MDAAEMTFGIEFECYLTYAVAAEIGNLSYGNPVQVPGMPEGWKAKTDGSLTDPPAGMTGVEVVSPVLKGADGIRQVRAACEWLAARGAKVNRTCGTHVHVGFDRSEMAALGRLVCLVARHEKAIFAATGTKARERARWCQSIKGDSYRAAKLQRRFRDGVESESLPSSHDERYVTLNVTNLARGVRDAVEFRAFAGTTSATKAIMHIRLCLGLVEKAFTKARKAEWDGELPACELKRWPKAGEGRRALVFLLLQLGWHTSYVSRPLGGFEAPGSPDLKACIAEAHRLATKYDGGADD